MWTMRSSPRRPRARALQRAAHAANARAHSCGSGVSLCGSALRPRRPATPAPRASRGRADTRPRTRPGTPPHAGRGGAVGGGPQNHHHATRPTAPFSLAQGRPPHRRPLQPAPRAAPGAPCPTTSPHATYYSGDMSAARGGSYAPRTTTHVSTASLQVCSMMSQATRVLPEVTKACDPPLHHSGPPFGVVLLAGGVMLSNGVVAKLSARKGYPRWPEATGGACGVAPTFAPSAASSAGHWRPFESLHLSDG